MHVQFTPDEQHQLLSLIREKRAFYRQVLGPRSPTPSVAAVLARLDTIEQKLEAS